MSVSGRSYQTRSRNSVTPSVAASDTASRKTRGPRLLDTYGSKDSDRAAAQQRPQEMMQNVGSAFGRSLDQSARRAMTSRAPSPNDQLQEVNPHDTTGNDSVRHDLDGATAHHTPARNSARTPRQKKRISYLALAMFIVVCLALFIYRSALLTGFHRTMRTGKAIQALVENQESLFKHVDRSREELRQNQESLFQHVDRSREELRQNQEEISRRFDSMEEMSRQRIDSIEAMSRQQIDGMDRKLQGMQNDMQYTVYAQKLAVDWFDPRNMAVTISKYTSPEKMRDVGGWMGLFKKQAPFMAVPEIAGPFGDVKKMWCAPSGRGKAQITVLLGQKIRPTSLVVEQLDTMETTPYWQTFPYQIELWASFDKDVPEPKIIPYPEDFPNPVSQGRKLASPQALPSSFRMLGRWQYSVEERRRRQTFYIKVNQPTNLVSFRVNSNHGDADQICLHKLHLYGNPTEPLPEPDRKLFKKDADV